jgi:hypothetical protein
VKPRLTHPEKREVFEGFLREVQGRGHLRGFSGCGIVQGYTITDPHWRFVLDAREPATPGEGFKVYIDDPNAPQPHAEIFGSGDMLDGAFCGEIHVRTALSEKLIRVQGDQSWTIRLIPVLMSLVPHYRTWRKAYAERIAAR